MKTLKESKTILRILCAALFVLVLCACTDENAKFTENKDGLLVSPSGVEYAHLANEGILYYLGELKFEGSVVGEVETGKHLGLVF